MMSSTEPRVEGAFGENGLISIKQIQPTILSFEKPLLSKSLESILIVLAVTLISIALYQAVTLDEFPSSQRLHLVLSAMGFLFFHALFTIIWVVRRMLKIARIKAVPNISEVGVHDENTLSNDVVKGRNGAIGYLDDSPERRQSNHSNPIHWSECPSIVVDTGSGSCIYGLSSGGPMAKKKGSIPSICAFQVRQAPVITQQSPVALAISSSGSGDEYGSGSKEGGNGDISQLNLRSRRRKREGEYIGESALRQSDIVTITRPVQNGIISDWEGMEAIWEHAIYTELEVDPTQQAMLISWSPSELKTNAETAVEVIFESFNVPAVYLAVSPVLSLYSNGMMTGCVIESGEGVTHACGVYEGFALPNGAVRSPINGGSATTYLQELLKMRGYNFNSPDQVLKIQDIKESICYTAREYDLEMKDALDRNRISAVLPDGTPINLERERIQVAEMLFRPNLSKTFVSTCEDLSNFNPSQFGLQHTVAKAIGQCQTEIRDTMWQNVVLSGGNTNFSFLPERLQSELTKISEKENQTSKVIAPIARENSVWLGGSVMASLGDSFVGNWIERGEFEEIGAMVVHSKCQTSLLGSG